MGDFETRQTIRRVAPLLGKVAADLRESPEAEALGQLIQTATITDPDGLDTLAALFTGLLSRPRGTLRQQHKLFGDVAIAIRRVAPQLSRVASILRRSPEAAALGRLIQAGKITDPDDLELLGDLVAGQLNRARGDRGRENRQMNEAIRNAQALARVKGMPEAHSAAVAKRFRLDPAKRLSLPDAAALVAAKHRVPLESLITELRRARPRRRSGG